MKAIFTDACIQKNDPNCGGTMFRNARMIQIAVLAIALIAPLGLSAISQAAPLFLTFEPGARANGMGRAYTAVADDAYAGWWNPAAMAFNRKTQLTATHMPWMVGAGAGFDDMFHQYYGWNQYFDGIGNLGAHITWLDAGTQMQMDEAGNELGEFHTFEAAFAMGYAYEMVPDKIGLGGNFKIIYSYLAPGTGNTDSEGKTFGYAFDIASKFNDVAGIEGLDAAAVIQNIGPNVTYVNEAQSDPLPMTIRLGAAYQVMDSQINDLKVSVEASKILANEDPIFQRFITGFEHMEETILATGAEYTYLDLITLRAGYFFDDAGQVKGPSFGAGFQYSFSQRYKLTADFGMITGGKLINDYNKVFSLGFEF